MKAIAFGDSYCRGCKFKADVDYNYVVAGVAKSVLDQAPRMTTSMARAKSHRL